MRLELEVRKGENLEDGGEDGDWWIVEKWWGGM